MASIDGSNQIVQRGDYGKHDEGFLKAAGTPGMNIVRTADFASQRVHSYTPGGTDYVGTGTSITTPSNPVKVLKENGLAGGGLDTAWASGSTAGYFVPKAGDRFLVLLKSGENAAKSVGLTADSTGKWVVDATNAAVETLEDSNGAVGADTHILVEML